jgi:threonine synthase
MTPSTSSLSPSPRSWFTCLDGCPGTFPITDVRLRCPTCGGLLDVVHDLAALKSRSADEWRALWRERRTAGAWPYQSGVWTHKELVCPELADDEVISLGEGWTPLVAMPRLGEALGAGDLLIKQMGHSPTGSFKDQGMTVLVSMVNALCRRGVAIPAVACASTGDTSAALAAYAARAGVPALVFLPAGKLSDEQLTQPISSFAITCALDTDFDGCMALVAAFCERHGVYLANSMNPLRIEGQKTLAFELAQQLGWQVPDWVVVPGGNLGHTTAIGRGFELLLALGLIAKLPRLCVAQAAAADPLYRAFRNGWQFQRVTAQTTQASAIQIGNPVNVPKAIAILRRLGGVVESATEAEITAAWLLGDRHGLYADPHTGVALAAVAKLVRDGHIERGQRVVVISTAHGLKFSAHKRDHHYGAPDSEPQPSGVRLRNPPLRLGASLAELEKALCPRLGL